MEILKSEGQLGKGTRMFRINRMFDTIEEYEYLCTHPHNERYAIVIDTMTKDPKKIYKDDLFNGEFHIGYTRSEVIGKLADEVEESARQWRKQEAIYKKRERGGDGEH